MNAVDTNVLIYSIDARDPVKRAKARALLAQLRTTVPQTVLLWQVAGEFARHLRGCVERKEISRDKMRKYLDLIRRIFALAMPTPAVLDRALELSARFGLSHWDSMLLGACVEAGVGTLYTEDMGAPRQIDSVRLINPF